MFSHMRKKERFARRIWMEGRVKVGGYSHKDTIGIGRILVFTPVRKWSMGRWDCEIWVWRRWNVYRTRGWFDWSWITDGWILKSFMIFVETRLWWKWRETRMQGRGRRINGRRERKRRDVVRRWEMQCNSTDRASVGSVHLFSDLDRIGWEGGWTDLLFFLLFGSLVGCLESLLGDSGVLLLSYFVRRMDQELHSFDTRSNWLGLIPVLLCLIFNLVFS